jgi:uncharacterized protein (UPF0333 family)
VLRTLIQVTTTKATETMGITITATTVTTTKTTGTTTMIETTTGTKSELKALLKYLY